MTLSPPVIRSMTPADLPAVGTLAGTLVRLHHQWDARRFFLEKGVEDGYRWFFGQQLQLAEPPVLLVAEVEGAIAGYLYGTVEPRDWAMLLDAHGAIHDVCVDATFRRRGIAKALMQAALTRFDTAGAKKVVLYSATANAEAQALFASLGFRTTMVEMTRDAG